MERRVQSRFSDCQKRTQTGMGCRGRTPSFLLSVPSGLCFSSIGRVKQLTCHEHTPRHTCSRLYDGVRPDVREETVGTTKRKPLLILNKENQCVFLFLWLCD